MAKFRGGEMLGLLAAKRRKRSQNLVKGGGMPAPWLRLPIREDAAAGTGGFGGGGDWFA